MNAHKCIISWSGGLSHQVALVLRGWLPEMFPDIFKDAAPWVSSEDIAKGKSWFVELMTLLQAQDVKTCIICLTPENLDRSWLYYEAGAIAAKSPDTIVCPFLIGVEGKDIQGTPFGQLQWTAYDKSDTLKLIRTINKESPAPINETVLSNAYNGLWQSLKRKIDKAIVENPIVLLPVQPEPKPGSQLSKEAKIILIGAAKDQNGVVFFGQDHGGFWVQVNGIDVYEPKGPRVEALFRDAIEELLNQGLTIARSDSLHGLTGKGFKLAEELEKASQPTTATANIDAQRKQTVASHAALISLKQKLDDLIEWWPRNRPPGARADLHAIAVKEYNDKMKNTLTDLLTCAKEEADKISLGAYFGAVSELDSMTPEYHALFAFAQRQVKPFEAVLQKLA